MDNQLRELERKHATGNTEATEQYIALLKRLAGLGDEKITIYTAIFTCHEGAGVGYTIGTALTEELAWKSAAEYCLGWLDDHEESDDTFKAKLQLFYDKEEFKNCTDYMIDNWFDPCYYSIELNKDELILG